MNWLHTIAALRAARIEDKRVASSLSALLGVSASRKQFMLDKKHIHDLGSKAWMDWRILPDGNLHNAIQTGLDRGNGLIIGSCFSGHYLPALSLIRHHASECLMMQGRFVTSGMSPAQLADFASATGVNVRIGRVDVHSSLTMVKHLKRNGIVFVMLDSPLEGMTTFSVDFFGAPAITGDGLYRLATKTGAAILPVFTPRTQQGLEVKTGTLQFAREESAEKLAANTLSSLQDLIWTDPSKWWLWDYLYRRWAGARHVLLNPSISPAG